jgi:hypothetical protein
MLNSSQFFTTTSVLALSTWTIVTTCGEGARRRG